MKDEINWSKHSQTHWKGTIDKQQIFIMDEMCCFDFKLNKDKNNNKGWKGIPIFVGEEE